MTQNEPIRVRPRCSPQAQREVRRNTRLRQARTCYSHLAGVAGVAAHGRGAGDWNGLKKVDSPFPATGPGMN